MAVVLLAFATFLFLLLALPWFLLVLSPLVVFAGSGSLMLRDLRHLRARAARLPEQGLLWLGGLERIGALEDLLGNSLRRVLAMAPDSAKARACACVKPTESGSVGVVRIWGGGGHWLMKTTGGSIAEAAWRANERLSHLETDFPAVPGTARLDIPECDPSRCPMRSARREATLATFAPA